MSPFDPGLELCQRTGNVKVLREEQAGVDTVFEDHLVDVVQDLLVVDLLHELVQHCYLVFLQGLNKTRRSVE